MRRYGKQHRLKFILAKFDMRFPTMWFMRSTKPHILQLCANDSYFAQSIYLIDKTDKIPCAILEWSDTILELRNQVGILTLRRAILEWYRFPLCAEHI